jgi:hypothetical protein
MEKLMSMSIKGSVDRNTKDWRRNGCESLAIKTKAKQRHLGIAGTDKQPRHAFLVPILKLKQLL